MIYPHCTSISLTLQNVTTIAEKIVEFYGDHTLCISVFQTILVICNIKDVDTGVGGYKERVAAAYTIQTLYRA